MKMTYLSKDHHNMQLLSSLHALLNYLESLFLFVLFGECIIVFLMFLKAANRQAMLQYWIMLGYLELIFDVGAFILLSVSTVSDY